jgi:5-methylcytosine-specific restriction endonuclease McrA
MKLVLSRLQRPADNGASLQGGKLPDVHQRTDIPLRADVGKLPSCKTHKYTLYGKQAGKCVGRQHHFPLVNFTIDHIVPKSKGGTDHLDHLQLLCNACNSSKEAIDQAAIFAELKAQGSRD